MLLALILLAGCLPSSCRRTPPQALFPSDSLSRRIASRTPVDTLRLVWQTSRAEALPLAYPRTVRFGPGGRIYVSDTERNRVFAFEAGGGVMREEIASEGFSYPYLAGIRGDTLVVFSPGAQHLDFVVDGISARQVPTPDALPERGRLQYAAATDEALYVKLVGEDFAGYIARLDEQGNVVQRYALPGPPWRHAGLLHAWGDSLLSLSGFRPVVDVIGPGGTLDTLALLGFDSPMLARSRAFVQGEVGEPPLLSAAAAAAGDLLFVLNLRPGWLHIDAYDRRGRLQRVLIQPDPGYRRRFYPVDLAARAHPDGSYDLAVVVVEPEPQLALYRWEGR